MATLTINSVGGEMRKAIRERIFAMNLVSEEDRGFFRSDFRIRGDGTSIETLNNLIERMQSILRRREQDHLADVAAREISERIRKGFRRDLRLHGLKTLLGIAAIRDEITRGECEEAFELVVLAEETGRTRNDHAFRRLARLSDLLGDLVFRKGVDDLVLSTMTKQYMAALREEVRSGDLVVSATLRGRIKGFGGRRRLPSLA